MYKLLAGLTLTFIALLAPASAAHAAVVISEVAWMGSSASANAEWIELQNTGAEAVALSGWTLTSSTGAPAISLTGTISGAGFYLLERTSDESAPSVPADQIYSGALSNSGATLTLKDSSGASIDTVAGGTNWASIGGDNTTKQTPQRTGDMWTTADPTPRAATASSGTGEEESTDTTPTSDPQTPQPSVAGITVVTGKRASPVPVLYIEAGSGKVVARGASVPFRAYAYDSNGDVRRDAKFDWSFGDGSGGEGNEVAHTYVLPGTYTITIHGRAGPSEALSTLSVRVDEPSISITVSDEKSIAVKNTSAQLLDVSSWYLARGEARFMLPPYTVLMAGQEAQFPSQITGLGSSTLPAHLLFPDGSSASEFIRVPPTTEVIETAPEEEITPPTVQPLSLETGIQEIEDAIPQIDTNSSSTYEETRAPSTLVNPSVLGASVSNSMPSFLKSPWTASFLGLLVAAGAVLVVL